MPVIIDTGVDNAGLRTGLLQAESMVDASVKRITVKMNAAGKLTGASMVFAPAATQQLEKNVGLLGLAATRMQKLQTVSSGLNSVLGRMTGIFSSGLGISAAIGGLALLGTAFSKAITMAQRFQTAQIAIGAILLSTYKVKDKSGQEAGGPAGFMYAHEQALKYNQQIIVRSRKNILTYEEQLKAFQVGLAAGGRKGIQPQMVMDISEQIAVGAKAIGLQGERIGEQVRILLGGGVNVQRSMFAKILGITSKDISSRSGEDLVKFIQSRMKGFSTKGVLDEFNNSIEAIITTMTSQIDVFLATVGTKVMKKLTPVLRGFGEFLQGPDAAKLGDTLVTGFTNVFTAIETLARSPAIPIIEKVVTFLASEADKIIIGAVLLRLVGVLLSVGAGVSSAIGWFNKLGLSAAVAAGEVQGLALATAEVGSGRVGGFGTAGATVVGAGGAVGGAAGAGSRDLTNALAGKGGMIAGGEAALLAGGGGLGLLGRAKGAVGRAGGWLKDGRGAAMAGRVGKGLMTGALTYGGIKIGADMAGMGDDAKPSGVYSETLARIAGGAVLGYQIGGVGGAVLGGSIGGASEVGTLYSQKVAADNQAGTNLLTSRTGLAQKTKALEEARDKALQNAKPNRAGVMDAGLQESTTRYWNAEAQRRQGQIDALPKQAAAEAEAKRKTEWEADPKNKGLRFVTDTERNDMAKAIAQSQSTAQQVAEGTGPLRQKQKAYWEFNTKALNLRKSIMEGDIKLVDADLIAKSDEVVKRRASLDNANSDNFNPAQQKRLRMFNTQQEDLKRRQGERYIKEARGGMTDFNQAIDRQRKAAKSEYDLPTIQGDFTKGQDAIREKLLGQKDLLGADYEPTLKKALANFDKVFDMRGKKIAQQIENLSLGVSADNVVESSRLAFKAVEHKISEAVKNHTMSVGLGAELWGQQKAQYISGLQRPALEMQQFTGENQIRQIQQRQELATVVPTAQRSLEQAQLQGREFEAGLNPRNARTMDRAQRDVGREQPEISYDDARKLVEDKISLARREQEASVQQAETGLQIAKIQRDTVIPALVQLAEDASTIKFAELAKTVEDAGKALARMMGGHFGDKAGAAKPIKALNSRTLNAEGTGYADGKGPTPHKALNAAGTGYADGEKPTISITIPKTEITRADIDKWIPQIKDALCKLVANSTGRG